MSAVNYLNVTILQNVILSLLISVLNYSIIIFQVDLDES